MAKVRRRRSDERALGPASAVMTARFHRVALGRGDPLKVPAPPG